VRELRWDDFDDITRAYWRLYDERDAGEPHGITLFARKPTLAAEVDWFASLYRRVLSGDAVSVVAELGDRVVGQCTVSRVGREPDAENGHVGELGIMVERGYRGRGVGHALLRAAIARSRGRFEVVRLGVHADNVGARHLYESFGFRLVGAIPRALRRHGTYTDDQLMALVLDRRAHPPTKR
jgi:RimJ/RimL family protein N-acetyltransferase